MSNAPLEFVGETDPLEDLGTQVMPPATEAVDAVRERFEEARTRNTYGKVADLAVWWAQARDDDRAPAPSRILAVGIPGTTALPTGTARRPLDPPADVVEAVAWGAALADEAVDAGHDLVLLAAPLGLTGRALTGYLMGLDPVETNGWPQGNDPDDEAWMSEVEVVRDVQWTLRGLRGRPIAMVRALDSAPVAAATALLLRCSARRTPVVLDGPGGATCAVLASRCSRIATRWWQPAEVGTVPLHERSLESIQAGAPVRLDLRVEDGTASTALLPLLGLAADLLARARRP